MDMTEILLANGFFLAVILLIMLVIFATSRPKRRRVKEDLKKIKDQVEEE
ncbi:hypothetical protein KW805_02985 [Candidatus Pacearchaeota archaeon]|nr:hypothetical protein [Candidatus Pacearchaeota archaeon]